MIRLAATVYGGCFGYLNAEEIMRAVYVSIMLSTMVDRVAHDGSGNIFTHIERAWTVVLSTLVFGLLPRLLVDSMLFSYCSLCILVLRLGD